MNWYCWFLVVICLKIVDMMLFELVLVIMVNVVGLFGLMFECGCRVVLLDFFVVRFIYVMFSGNFCMLVGFGVLMVVNM